MGEETGDPAGKRANERAGLRASNRDGTRGQARTRALFPAIAGARVRAAALDITPHFVFCAVALNLAQGSAGRVGRADASAPGDVTHTGVLVSGFAEFWTRPRIQF